jgi:hypothetical protein
MPEEEFDTSAASIVRDHAFEPREDPMSVWSDFLNARVVLLPNEALCRRCRLAEAAHIR